MLVSNSSNKETHLPNPMTIDHAKSPPDVKHAIASVDFNILSILGTEENNKPSRTLDLHQTSDFSAVHYKPMKSREAQMQRHIVLQDNESRKQTQSWRNKVTISDKCLTYRDDSMDRVDRIPINVGRSPSSHQRTKTRNRAPEQERSARLLGTHPPRTEDEEV